LLAGCFNMIGSLWVGVKTSSPKQNGPLLVQTGR
jgi:hypothetical protein